jgi:hypothetical protein
MHTTFFIKVDAIGKSIENILHNVYNHNRTRNLTLVLFLLNTQVFLYIIGRSLIKKGNQWKTSLRGSLQDSFFFLNSGRGLEDPRFSSINVAGTKFYRKPLIKHTL